MSGSLRSQVFWFGLVALGAVAAYAALWLELDWRAVSVVGVTLGLAWILWRLQMWPGRPLVLAALVPALIALTMTFRPNNLGPVLLVDAVFLVWMIGTLIRDAGTVRAGSFRIERAVNPTLSIGEPDTVTLTIDNLSHQARRLEIRDDIPEHFDADPETMTVTIGPRERAVLEYRVIPRRRGSYTFGRVDALVGRGRGWWSRSLSWPVSSPTRVYPDVRQITRYTLLARKDRLNILGLRRSRAVGQDNEFERLRDYVPGDEPRHVDWRSTARRQKLTVRAHQINQSQRVLFLIDCGRMMAGDTGQGQTPLDHAFNAMLMLAHVALIRGDQVGLLAYSDRIRAYVPLAGGPKRINTLVHAVHDVFPELVESRHDLAFLELEKRYGKRALVILLTNVFDDVNAAMVMGHLGRLAGKHLPLGVLLRDRDLFDLADAAGESGPGFYRGAAAASMLNWRERVLAGMRQRGVMTLDVLPEDLTAPMVNQYLEIKARHLL